MLVGIYLGHELLFGKHTAAALLLLLHLNRFVKIDLLGKIPDKRIRKNPFQFVGKKANSIFFISFPCQSYQVISCTEVDIYQEGMNEGRKEKRDEIELSIINIWFSTFFSSFSSLSLSLRSPAACTYVRTYCDATRT